MSIKRKLSIVLLLVESILLFNATFLLKSLFDTQKRVERLNDSTLEIEKLMEINLNIGLQSIEIMDYFFGEIEAEEEYREHSEDLEKALKD